jgi:hypothetical protein
MNSSVLKDERQHQAPALDPHRLLLYGRDSAVSAISPAGVGYSRPSSGPKLPSSSDPRSRIASRALGRTTSTARVGGYSTPLVLGPGAGPNAPRSSTTMASSLGCSRDRLDTESSARRGGAAHRPSRCGAPSSTRAPRTAGACGIPDPVGLADSSLPRLPFRAASPCRDGIGRGRPAAGVGPSSHPNCSSWSGYCARAIPTPATCRSARSTPTALAIRDEGDGRRRPPFARRA